MTDRTDEFTADEDRTAGGGIADRAVVNDPSEVEGALGVGKARDVATAVELLSDPSDPTMGHHPDQAVAAEAQEEVIDGFSDNLDDQAPRPDSPDPGFASSVPPLSSEERVRAEREIEQEPPRH
jgi:hypothetical protein